MLKQRLERINAELRQEISDIINYTIKDPRVKGMVSVISVDTDNDLYKSDVYLSILADKDVTQTTFKALKDCEGFVRKQVASRVQLRNTPIINFKLDKSTEYTQEIEDLLSQIKIDED